jgi:hypothetical protein
MAREINKKICFEKKNIFIIEKEAKNHIFNKIDCLNTATRAELPQDVHLVLLVERHPQEGVDVVMDRVFHLKI